MHKKIMHTGISFIIASLAAVGLNTLKDSYYNPGSRYDIGESFPYSRKTDKDGSTIVRTFEIGSKIHKIYIDPDDYILKKGYRRNAGLEEIPGYTDPDDEELIELLKHNLDIPSGNKEEDAEKIMDFVHRHVYVPDRYNHVKTPIETIVEGCGDCEDLSILAGSMLAAAKIDFAYIAVPAYEDKNAHILVGIAGDFKGESFSHKGKKYYAAETTGTRWPGKPAGWKIGQLPDKSWKTLDVKVLEYSQ
ncbi:hypothetical protein GF336_06290 [Candidatus Woesearchaeota archaeon]|nr:hypothetical protein [Candidatus Woesearchaeota archaeon]